MSEFKPTPNNYICDHAQQCKANCYEKESHEQNNQCINKCDRLEGIPESTCIPIPLSGSQLISDNYY
jgi:hypothetical protein